MTHMPSRRSHRSRGLYLTAASYAACATREVFEIAISQMTWPSVLSHCHFEMRVVEHVPESADALLVSSRLIANTISPRPRPDPHRAWEQCPSLPPFCAHGS